MAEKHNGLSDAFIPRNVSSKSSRDSSCDYDMDKPTGRHIWSTKREYILSMVGYCVGLGNIWRFPYVCIQNGGGAFLIPFLISLVLFGMPVFFLETALGQFLGKSSLHIWSICPLFKGMGVSMNILSIICSFYYSTILAYTLVFMVNSFKSPLPWTLCDQSWNTPDCISTSSNKTTTTITPSSIDNNTISDYNSTNVTISSTTVTQGSSFSLLDQTVGPTLSSILLSDNDSVLNNTWLNNTLSGSINVTTAVLGSENSTEEASVSSSSEEFWLHNVLELSPSLEQINGIPWHMGVALLAANTIVLIGIFKGIQTSGKVVYVTATLPYFLLTVILILGCTLPGAWDGVLYYIRPDFGILMTYQPWMQAAIQVFYSLGTGWGAIITMASYNKFKNNCMRDSIILVLCCEGTSVFGGFAIFTILGHMAYKAKVHISTFAKSGAGLTFVVYPEAVSYLPLPQLWAFLFFLMIFLIGLDTMFSMVETIITVIADLWPETIRRWRITVTSVTMVFFTLIGLIFTSRGGMYWFQLVDWYIAAFALLLQGSIECVVVAWIYGLDRFAFDIELMVGRKPMVFFEWTWKFITPLLLLVLWVLTLAFYEAPTYNGKPYPAYAEVFGWTLAVLPFLAVIVCAVYELLKHSGTLSQRLRKATTPSPSWLPSSLEARSKYRNVTTLMLDNLGTHPTDHIGYKV